MMHSTAYTRSQKSLTYTLLSALAILVLFFLFKPFITIWLLMASGSLYLATSEKNARLIVTLIISLTAIVLTPYISTKTGLAIAGNDKKLYLEFMYQFLRSDFLQSISTQPEFVSFFIIKVAAQLFGPSDEAFALIFLVSFTLLAIGAIRINQRASLAFMLFFLSSSVFFNVFGNTIRQGLALSFIFIVISEQSRRKYLFMLLAIFSHFSAFALAPYILIRGLILRLSLKSTVLFFCCSYIAGFTVSYVMNMFSFSWEYLEKKRSLYVDLVSEESGIAKITFFVILAIVLFTRTKLGSRLAQKAQKTTTKEITALDSLYALTAYISLLLFFVMQITDFFARYYLYFLVISVFYISIYIYTRKSNTIRVLGVLFIVLYASASVVNNFYKFPLFYCSKSSDFLTDNVLAIIGCL
ncbi:EpsG family protein [Pseudomonas sp. BF-R-24]|uniref:EpsG family protein n=1 Tax=Pseudomonas sp. BF-R-24 TaxID=2832386 RepID=UPI001CBCEBDB|nr:EpsG family protein [Pseudomonas sp. BF-R-24]